MMEKVMRMELDGREWQLYNIFLQFAHDGIISFYHALFLAKRAFRIDYKQAKRIIRNMFDIGLLDWYDDGHLMLNEVGIRKWRR